MSGQPADAADVGVDNYVAVPVRIHHIPGVTPAISPVDTTSSSSSSSSSASSASSSSSASPRTGTPSSPHLRLSNTDRCCVVACQASREKDGYCMPHWELFKGPGSGRPPQSQGSKSGSGSSSTSSRKSATMPKPVVVAPPKRTSASKQSRGGGSGCFPFLESSSGDGGGSGSGIASATAPASMFAAASNNANVIDASAALLKELRQAWKSSHKVVFKDLPRLAKRISIQTESEGIIVEKGRRVQPQQQPQTPLSTATTSLSSAAASSSVDGSGSSSGGSSRSSSPSPDSIDTWTAVSTVVVSLFEVLESRDPSSSDPSSSAAASSSSSSAASASTSSSLPSSVQSRSQALRQSFDDVAHNLAQSGGVSSGDHPTLLEEIFQKHIGFESSVNNHGGNEEKSARTFRVLQAVHQAILFPPIAHLHQGLFRHPAVGGRMKDVRREDGWTVLIYVGAAVYVTHQRWEQSLHPPTSPEHFEVCWEVRLSFDLGLLDLRASIMRIQDIKFHAEATEDYKKSLRLALTGNGYIV